MLCRKTNATTRKARRRGRRAVGRLELLALERRELLTAPGLTLSLASHSVGSDAGPGAATGTVVRTDTDNTLPLTVSLASGLSSAAVGALI